MSGIESGFTFGGKHCMNDFGLLYVEDKGGRIITHARRINEYTIAGASGTVRFPGEAYEKAILSGALYPMTSPTSEAEAQALMRSIDAWLYGPRDKLIFDYEPDKYRLAEVTGESKWSYRDWIDGGLAIEFDVQPFAYAVTPTTPFAYAVVPTPTQPNVKEYVYAINVETGLEAPLEATITNSGTAKLTGVTIDCGSKRWSFEDMSITQCGVLAISMESPIGATITQGNVITNALPHATRFDVINIEGETAISVKLTFDGSAHSDSVALSARGRWL